MADFYAARAGTNAGAPLDGFLTAVHTRITNKQCVAVYDRAVIPKLEADSPAPDLPQLATLRTILQKLHITTIARA